MKISSETLPMRSKPPSRKNLSNLAIVPSEYVHKKRRKNWNPMRHHRNKKKFETLSQHFNPIPFSAARRPLDIASHPHLLQYLGLWDFLNLDYDLNIRTDLIKELVVCYNPKRDKIWTSRVHGKRIALSRCSLATALHLPAKRHNLCSKDDHKCVDFVVSQDEALFVEQLVLGWLVLKDDDPEEVDDYVSNFLKHIREMRFEEMDWAGLIWFMVKRELLKGKKLMNCYYASHLQQLLKKQKPELFDDHIADVGSSGIRSNMEEMKKLETRQEKESILAKCHKRRREYFEKRLKDRNLCTTENRLPDYDTEKSRKKQIDVDLVHGNIGSVLQIKDGSPTSLESHLVSTGLMLSEMDDMNAEEMKKKKLSEIISSGENGEANLFLPGSGDEVEPVIAGNISTTADRKFDAEKENGNGELTVAHSGQEDEMMKGLANGCECETGAIGSLDNSRKEFHIQVNLNVVKHVSLDEIAFKGAGDQERQFSAGLKFSEMDDMNGEEMKNELGGMISSDKYSGANFVLRDSGDEVDPVVAVKISISSDERFHAEKENGEGESIVVQCEKEDGDMEGLANEHECETGAIDSLDKGGKELHLQVNSIDVKHFIDSEIALKEAGNQERQMPDFAERDKEFLETEASHVNDSGGAGMEIMQFAPNGVHGEDGGDCDEETGVSVLHLDPQELTSVYCEKENYVMQCFANEGKLEAANGDSLDIREKELDKIQDDLTAEKQNTNHVNALVEEAKQEESFIVEYSKRGEEYIEPEGSGLNEIIASAFDCFQVASNAMQGKVGSNLVTEIKDEEAIVLQHQEKDKGKCHINEILEETLETQDTELIDLLKECCEIENLYSSRGVQASVAQEVICSPLSFDTHRSLLEPFVSNSIRNVGTLIPAAPEKALQNKSIKETDVLAEHFTSEPDMFMNLAGSICDNPSNDGYGTESRKAVSCSDAYDPESMDLDFCSAQLEVWTSRLKNAARKQVLSDQELKGMMLKKLEEHNQMVEQYEIMKKELQQNRKDVRKHQQELHLMQGVLQDYRKALKQARQSFAKYRERFPFSSESIYMDHPGGGGRVILVSEWEKSEKRRERKTRLVIEAMMKNFADEWVSKLEGHYLKCDSLCETLEAIGFAADELKGKRLKA